MRQPNLACSSYAWLLALTLAPLLAASLRAQDDPAAFRTEVKALAAQLGALERTWEALSGGLDAASRAGLPSPAKPPGPELDQVGSCAELYGLGLKCEADALRVYRQVRALALAQRRKQPFGEALKQTSVLLPVRPPYQDPPAKPAKPQPLPRKIAPPVPDDEIIPEGSGAEGAAPAQTAGKLGVLRAVRLYVERLSAAAQAQQQAGGAVPVPQTGSAKIEDPFFGPWYLAEPPPHAGDKPNALPTTAGEDGVQQWLYLRGWQVLAPLPLDVPAAEAPLLPCGFDTCDATYSVGTGRTAATANWERLGAENGTGFVSLDKGSATAADSMMLAGTAFWSEKETDLWLAAACAGRLSLWLNERLVVVGSPAPEPDRVEDIVVFPAHVRQGLNRVLLRGDNTGAWMRFWVRVCTRGRPRPAAEAQARWAAVREKVSSIRHLPPQVQQFRGDGAANWPEAHPVTAWDWEKGANILWRVPLDWSKSSPLVVKDRVFTQVEPHILVCVDAQSGKVLWERDSSILELLDKDLYAQSQKLYADYRQEYDRARKALFSLGDTPTAQTAALVKQGQAEVTAHAQVEKLRAALEKKQDAWIDFVLQNGKCPKPVWYRHGEGPWTGYSFATPVSDGNLIWVKYATGVTACYDMEGTRKWLVKTESALSGNSECSSPVLAGDKLVMKVLAVAPVRGQAPPPNPWRLLALDAASGKVAWSVPYEARDTIPTPLVMRLTDGHEEMTVVVDRCGLVVRAEDGKVLIRSLHGGEARGSLTAAGDRLYRLGSCYGLHMVEELLMLDRDTVGARLVASHYYTQRVGDCGYAYRDGVLFSLSGRGGHMANSGFWPVDAENGRHIEWHTNRGEAFCQRGPDEAGGANSVPPTIGGAYAFISDRGVAPRVFDRDYAQVTVLQAARHGLLVAQNRLEKSLTAHFAYQGERIYVRSDSWLTCIGYTGDAGRVYEAEENARRLFEELRSDGPKDTAAVAVKPNLTAGSRARLNIGPVALHESACVLGPLPLEQADAALAAIGGPSGAGFTDKTPVTVKGASVKPTPLGGRGAKKDYKTLKDGRVALDLAKVLENRAAGVVFLSAALTCEGRGTLRLLCDTPGVDLWLGGVAVKDQDRVTIAEGAYSLVVRAKVEQVPAGGLPLLVRFADSPGGPAETQEWLAAIRRSKDMLERIIRLKPDSDAARRAKACLEQLRP